MTASLKIIFMGTPDFAVPALQALIDSSHQVIAVYSQPPRPKGRGQQLANSPVHELALKHNIPVYTPLSLKKSPEAQAELAGLQADVAVVAAYGLILPQAVLDAPKYGCLNIHGSILPRWRGASPIQHAVWHGDVQTGITIMQMDAGLDTGPMIVMETVPITDQTTSVSLYNDLGAIGARLIVKVVDQLARDGTVVRVPQPDTGMTYAPMLKKEDGQIDWTKPASAISCQIRALNPWPGTTAKLPDGQVIKVFAANVLSTTMHQTPGTIIDRSGQVACGDGTVLQLTAVQAPSGKKMDFSALINGGYVAVGQSFVP